MSDEPKLPHGIEYGDGGRPVAYWINGQRFDAALCVGCGKSHRPEVTLELDARGPVQNFCSLECLHLHLDGCREALQEAGKAGATVEKIQGKTWLLLPGIELGPAVEDPRKIADELADLCKAAAARICKTVRMAREARKYGPYSWNKEDGRRQAERAWRHLANFLEKTSAYYAGQQNTRGAGGEQDALTELEHAITRLAILAALQDGAAAGRSPF